MKNSTFPTLRALILCMSICAPMYAHAGLFDDDEARKAILDLRAKLEETSTRLESKADKNSSLMLANQSEQIQNEITKLRGQIELMNNELTKQELQRKDFYLDLDKRLQKLEPQKTTIDGKEFVIQPAEQKSYDFAFNTFKNGEYKRAVSAFADFITNYPQSGLSALAQYWLGASYYALRDYKSAIAAQQVVLKKYPNSSKVTESLLNIANCYTELKDKTNAKKTLERLIKDYPESPAAKSAKEILTTL